ncbi:MAG: SDR family oxidoreductase [Chloroflexota bacterium]|nr:SDR family oxidoreductase [Chloroflexota bacterium]
MALTNFDGAVAVITGGASGIGLATARTLHALGADIVLADINTEGLQRAEEQIHQNNPNATGKIRKIPTDVTREDEVQHLMHETVDMFDRIDVVIASAGIGRGGPIDTYSAADMQTIMNINFMGTYHCVRAALPTMRKQHSGHFVLMSSVAGKLGAPMMTAYCATKWAVRGFSIALRAELHDTGIGVTTVYPAWVDTPMIHQEQGAMQALNIQVLLTPDQVANEIVQAIKDDRRDLTLAPNPDIALILQIMKDDPDKAEMLSGAAFRRQMSGQ